MTVMLLDNDEPTSYDEAMMSPDSDKWLGAMKSKWNPCMKTKYGLWWIFPATARPLRTNGYSKERQTRMETSPCIKLDLSQKVSDKFKELTTMRHSHP